ncbi:MAG: winged helix-turn-helix domain-containing protein [Nanoarchaeota archaeon]
MKKKEETFLLVSMKEGQAKKLAQVISSDTSRKILDHLAKSDSTESQIAELLNMPLSTVHYNLQALLEAKLIKVDEFHYSEKGKEVNHYTIANKFIIIAPDSTEGLSVKIKRTLPALVLLLAGVGIIHFLQEPALFAAKNALALQDSAKVLAESAGEAIPMAADALRAAPAVAETLPSIPLPAAAWFLFGGVAVLIGFLLSWMMLRRQ